MTRPLVLLFFILITFPAFKSLLHPGLFSSHDLEGHVIRLIEFHRALDDGHFPVRWSQRLNSGLGYPYFNFNYPGVYYLGDLLVRLTGSVVFPFKFLFLISFPLSAFFAYLWLSKSFSRPAAFFGGLLYTLVPYHFLNVYVRGNIGEALALTILPLCFYFLSVTGASSLLLLSVSISLLLLFHNLIAAVFLPFIFLFSLLNRTSSKFLKSLTLALGLTAFFWIPAIFTLPLVKMPTSFATYYLHNFPTLQKIIYSPWGFGLSNVGQERGEMSVQVGLPQLGVLAVAVGFAIYLLINRRRTPGQFIFFLFSGLAFLYLITPWSLPVWQIITPLQTIQFPWRLLSGIVLCTSFLGAFLFDRFRSFFPSPQITGLVFVLALVALLYCNRNHWRTNYNYSLADHWLTDDVIFTTTAAEREHTPVWQNTDLDNPTHAAAFPSTVIKLLTHRTNLHRFWIQSSNDSLFTDRTVYFPGWRASVDSRPTAIYPASSPDTQGLITIYTPPGSHVLEMHLSEPPLNRVANIISLLSLAFLTFHTCFHPETPRRLLHPRIGNSTPPS